MSKSIHHWISAYGENHQNPTNKKIHWVCVPIIMFTLLGLLSLVNFNISLNEYVYDINISYVLIIFTLFFYLRLSIVISVGMFLTATVQLIIIYYFGSILSDQMLLYIYLGVFITAWIGQFIGHKIEGKKPSFFKDLQFLLIGPAWLLGFIYRKLGIRY